MSGTFTRGFEGPSRRIILSTRRRCCFNLLPPPHLPSAEPVAEEFFLSSLKRFLSVVSHPSMACYCTLLLMIVWHRRFHSFGVVGACDGDEGGRDETPCHPLDRGCKEMRWSWSLTRGVWREGEIVAFPFSFRQHLIRQHRRLWRRGKSRSPHCHRGRSSLREVDGALSSVFSWCSVAWNAVISSESNSLSKMMT